MSFTEEERQRWHADRRAGREERFESGIPAETCGHCGNPFQPGAGVVTADFSLCDLCNGD